MSKKIIFLIETHGTGFRNVTINPKKKYYTLWSLWNEISQTLQEIPFKGRQSLSDILYKIT